MVTSWCDKLASTPTAGLRLNAKFRPSERILDSLSALLDDQTRPTGRGEFQTFQIEQRDAFQLTFVLQDGFRYAVTPTNVSVGFAPRMELRPKSAGMPTLQLLSEPLPYTVALPKVCERLVETALRIPDVDGRKIMQFGIVSTSVVSVDEMPPGIKTLIETTIKPWGEQEAYTIQVASILNNNSDFSDRCIHTITNPEDKETIPTVSLDWQRTFKTPRFLRKNVLEEIVPRGRDEALAYFEQLGEKGAVHV